jgi:hypothetical protein
MMTRWIALLAMALALGGCAGAPPVRQTANAVVVGGPSGR